jgi:ATP-dependent Clp protease adaptor protein ClpS
MALQERRCQGAARRSRSNGCGGGCGNEGGGFPVNMPDRQLKTSPSDRAVAELQLEGIWRVVVLNDPVNLMSYVVLVFKKVFGFDDTTARKHMLEVHEGGRSVVWVGLREKAEAYVFTLQQWHLSAVLESDEAH